MRKKGNYYPLLVRWFRRLVQGYSRLQVIGREHLPEPGQPVILACHHSGSLWWDAICLAAALPQREIRFVAQQWDSEHFGLAALLDRVGALYETLDAEQIDENNSVTQALRNGHTVCVYPEQSYHTYWRRYTLYQFATHVIRYAELSQAPIIPTAIIGAEEAAPTLFGWKSHGMPFHFPMQPPFVLPWKITIEFSPSQNFEQLTRFSNSSGSNGTADPYRLGAERLRATLAAVIRRYRRCETNDLCYLDHAGWW